MIILSYEYLKIKVFLLSRNFKFILHINVYYITFFKLVTTMASPFPNGSNTNIVQLVTCKNVSEVNDSGAPLPRFFLSIVIDSKCLNLS